MSSLNVAQVHARVRALLPKLSVVLKHYPTAVKYLVAFIFLINFRAWPFVWHFRIFRPVFVIQLRRRLLELRLMFSSRRTKRIALDRFSDNLAPIGVNILDEVVSYNAWASIDESDFNGHLSNSSYAKVLDAARFKAGLQMYPLLFRETGWIALAGTHYHFIREIPMLATYEVRSLTVAWDHKWSYIIHRFVRKPKKGSKPPKSIAASDSVTPSATASSSNPGKTIASASSLLNAVEPDGAIVHTIVVSQICFKIGRITIPPEIVMAINGHWTNDEPRKYSHKNPPPHWRRVQALASWEHGGSRKKMAEFLKGGWKNVPEGERWWEDALAGARERKEANLRAIESLRTAMDSARGVWTETPV